MHVCSMTKEEYSLSLFVSVPLKSRVQCRVKGAAGVALIDSLADLCGNKWEKESFGYILRCII